MPAARLSPVGPRLSVVPRQAVALRRPRAPRPQGGTKQTGGITSAGGPRRPAAPRPKAGPQRQPAGPHPPAASRQPAAALGHTQASRQRQRTVYQCCAPASLLSPVSSARRECGLATSMATARWRSSWGSPWSSRAPTRPSKWCGVTAWDLKGNKLWQYGTPALPMAPVRTFPFRSTTWTGTASPRSLPT